MAKSSTRSQAGTEMAVARGMARPVVLKAAELFQIEETAGAPLIVSAVVAFAWANSPWSGSYHDFWTTSISIQFAAESAEFDVRHAINDFLMPLFFYIISLELKHAVTLGELSTWKRAAMPLYIGLGGMVVPALFYLAVNFSGDGQPSGWAVPVATDIAFAIAIIMLFGKRLPAALKILTLAFAAVDDVGGVLAIAFFYSKDVLLLPLGVAAGMVLLFVVAQRFGVRSIVIYAILSLAVLFSVYWSGVHTTVAGVVLGLLVSARPNFDREAYLSHSEDLLQQYDETHRARLEVTQSDSKSEEELSGIESLQDEEEQLLGKLDFLTAGTEAPVKRAMRLTNPWVSYLVLPLFALANAGVTVDGEMISSAATSLIAWGVLAGLVIGKPLGILGSAYAAKKLGLAELPAGVDWPALTGMAFLAGIGFTVSLFIAELAFSGRQELQQAKIAILLATVIATLAGGVVLWLYPRLKKDT